MSILAVALALLTFSESSATTEQVPLAIQLPAYLKALGYDRSLEVAGGNVVVAVVFDPQDASSTASRDRILEVQRQLTRLRVKGKPVVFQAVPYARGSELGPAHAILVTSLAPEAVEDISTRSLEAGTVTLATSPEDVARGLVLGMESRDGKPRFVFNLRAAEASGATFESNFLNLCRIVEH